MIVVSDSGPIIHPSWINRLILLQQLFQNVLVPPAVEHELLSPPSGTRGLAVIQRAFLDGWLEVRTLQSEANSLASLRPNLGPGEREAIARSIEMHADMLLSDDASGRREATRHGATVRGTAGILRAAATEASFLPPRRFSLSSESRDVAER